MTEQDFKTKSILLGAAIFCTFLGVYELIARLP